MIVSKILLILTLSSVCQAQTVTIFKQWHQSPGIQTTDIQKSKNLPQAKNQFEIYDQVNKLIESKKTKVVISEGCEGEINDKSELKHYGWSYSDLKKLLKEEFKNSLPHIGLKLEVAHPEVNSYCGDNEALIKQSQLAFSDLRAYVGYYTRLKEFKNKDQKKFDMYAKGIFDAEKISLQDQAKADPIQIAARAAKNSLQLIEDKMRFRNDSFILKTQEHLKDNPVIIIGGLHVDDLKSKLEAKKIKVVVIEPSGYNSQDEALLLELKKILQ